MRLALAQVLELSARFQTYPTNTNHTTSAKPQTATYSFTTQSKIHPISSASSPYNDASLVPHNGNCSKVPDVLEGIRPLCGYNPAFHRHLPCSSGQHSDTQYLLAHAGYHLASLLHIDSVSCSPCSLFLCSGQGKRGDLTRGTLPFCGNWGKKGPIFRAQSTAVVLGPR